MRLNKLLKSSLNSLGLLSLLFVAQPALAFGISPSTIDLDGLLPNQRYEHRFYVSDSSLGSVREFSFKALEDPYNVLSFENELITLEAEESQTEARLYIDTSGLELGDYSFSIQVKEERAPINGINQIVPGISFSGEISVTDEEVSLIEVNNLRLIKDEIEKELNMAVSLINKGNVPENLDLIEMMIHNEKNELVHTEVWASSDEIAAFQDEEFVYEVDLPRLRAGNYSIQVSALEDGEWIYESPQLPYQVIGKVQTDWILTVLLLILLTVSLFLYFSSRPQK